MRGRPLPVTGRPSRPVTRRTGRLPAVVAAVAAVALVAGCGLDDKLPVQHTSSCQVTSTAGNYDLEPDQMSNAATIAAVALRRNLPDHAITVALATALQESKLHNLTGGDRDSIGLFQQRPSQDWGTPQQISDPRYAAGEFYDHLIQIDGWASMRVTDAAQEVQRSAGGEEYQKWAAEAETLANALAGNTHGTVSCHLYDSPKFHGPAAQQALINAMRLDWGGQLVVNTSGQIGLTVPVTDERTGWQFTHWMTAHAGDTGLEQVRYQRQQWTAASGKWLAARDGQNLTSVTAQAYAASSSAKADN